MALPVFLRKVKKTFMKYFPSPAWPWEIVSGLLIVLVIINSLRFSSMDPLSINRLFFVFNILTIDLIWGIFDGWMLVFTNLLTEGRYNKIIITRVKSSDKNLASEIIKMELDNTIIGRCDEETRKQIVEMVLKSLSSISQGALEKPRISRDHFIAALICIFFVFLPSIVISPFFLLISDLNSAILVSNIIGLGMLFAFGYKLGACTGRNKIITGIITMLIGLAIIVAAIVFSA